MNSGEPMYSPRECPDKPINGKEGQDIMHRQSDYSVVSKKPMKVGGEKGIAARRRDARETPTRPRTGAQVVTKLASLSQRARENPKYQFLTPLRYRPLATSSRLLYLDLPSLASSRDLT